jgi:hypothetical protein
MEKGCQPIRMVTEESMEKMHSLMTPMNGQIVMVMESVTMPITTMQSVIRTM